MKKYLLLLVSFLLIGLTACGKDEKTTEKAQERVGLDTSAYNIEDEIIYANILNSTQQYIEQQVSKGNEANGLLRMATIYGNIDLLSLKQEVINRFNDVAHKNDADRTLYISEPIFKAVGNMQPQHTDYIDALIFHSIFNPQIQPEQNVDITPEIAALGLKIAVTRADIPYWFNEIRQCVDKKIDTSKIATAGDIPENAYDVINSCSGDYTKMIEAETNNIYAEFTQKGAEK
ncbi:MAG: hypothetical protein VZR95_01970 [Alphaproteobacteria bacterium]